jgi:GDPmannose 4,6-dehydratase
VKKAFVIGYSGQDGSYLSKLLLTKGYEVIGITRSVESINRINLQFLQIEEEIKVLEIQEADKKALKIILEEYQPDEIYNLSAQSSVGRSFQQPLETVSYNILTVLNWLEAIKEVNPAIRFYQASSSEMFGNISSLPLKESLVFHPASPYGVSKAAAHWLTVNYREANNMFCACGILFNHESVLRGPDYVVKKVIHNAVKISLGISDKAFRIGNTAIRRDWGYAPMFVEAMWRILQHDKAEDFLVCSGNVMSLTELIDHVFSSLSLDKEKFVKPDPSLFRPVDLEEIYGDNTKAKEKLNWKYSLSNGQLVSKLIEDEREFINWKLSGNLPL